MTLPSPTELSILASALMLGAVAAFFLLKDLRLAAEIGMAGAFVFLLAGAAHTYKQQGVDEQLATDKPVIAAQANLVATYKEADAMNQQAIGNLTKAYHSQADAITTLMAKTDAAQARAAAAEAQGDRDAAHYAAQAADFKRRMLAPPDGGNECEEADKALREVVAPGASP